MKVQIPVWRIKGSFIAVAVITSKEIKIGVTNLSNYKEMPLRIEGKAATISVWMYNIFPSPEYSWSNDQVGIKGVRNLAESQSLRKI